MIDHNWYLEHRVLEVRPIGPLTEDDFQSLAAQVDPVIRECGRLSGLLINAQHFAGWDNFVALLAHLRFVRDHQKHIHKIAVVSDHKLLGIMPRLVDHFVSAEVRPFASAEFQRALDWLGEPG
ncbi:STAS/SEC14 domain-containing protein [Microbulbifer taiwanensis]|uniref:STAS/SEC14 domain-containing protein n=1 Tax=Microbulbifer taiwanensis TaxID=986746 RepID=A0ABW1YH98_9GAMM|nr:STAS/SEC14 domain-containing protein [Microbulbifer taiwanensis]